ncbi:MAG: helix-turn-helix domain-containing protein [Treponema sp.]|nr:helix-turn-helix domain-containing protein [Treponema sp.]
MKEILRSLRNQNNYSQSAVAEYLGVSRQMYNKYEKGTAEPSLKNIKKLCELYKVSADVLLNIPQKNEKTVSYSSTSDSSSCLNVASPAIPYGKSHKQTNSKKILAELINLLPLLHLNEQISLMSRLATIIENQTCIPETPVIKTKKIKKIPDTAYNQYINSMELQKIHQSSLAAIREILKNDEW